MLRKYVTSMTRQMFEDYGRTMLEGFVRYWPKGELVVYSEDGDLPLKNERIKYRSVYQAQGLTKFLDSIKNFPMMSGLIGGQPYNYQYNVNGFCRKAFAQMDAAKGWNGHLFWVDADVHTFKHIPAVKLEQTLDGSFMAIMKRKTWHVCSSFVGWDCSHGLSKGFWDHYRFVYESGALFGLTQWDDAFVLENVVSQLPAVKDIAKDITGEGPYNVFDDVFEGYARHLKGNLKKAA